MKWLLLVACFFLVACSSTTKNSYVRASGEGNTFEEAKNNAFKEAIEYHLGVVIASERESHNDKLTKNEILAYSSGYVNDYKIISNSTSYGKVRVVVDVDIERNRIGDRILSKSNDTKNVDGAKHQAQYQTFLHNKQNGDKLLQSILNDYPRHAYNLTQGKHSLHLDSARNLSIVIPYEISWNKNYLNAFNDALKLLDDGRLGLFHTSVGNVSVGNNKYYFNDTFASNNILDAISEHNEVRLLLTVRDISNRIVYSDCYMPEFTRGIRSSLYEYSYVRVIRIGLFPARSENSKIEIKMRPNVNLNNLSSVELSVATKGSCQKFN
jgi:hypothetical protein